MISQTEVTLHTERKGSIGGSDVGALWNLDFGCRRRLGYQVQGIIADFPKEDRPEFERGHYMEDVVARLFADKTRRPVSYDPAGRRHPDYPYMVVHMDRIIQDPKRQGSGYLEIKVVNYRTFKKFMKEGLKGSYILQGQHGLAVTSWEWGSYAVLCLEPWLFKWFDYERDQELIDKIIAEEKQFMSDLEHNVEFARLPEKDRRCFSCEWRLSCKAAELANLIPPGERDAELIELPELLPLAAEINELKSMGKDIEAMIEELNSQAMTAINSHATLAEDGKTTIYPAGARYPGGRTLRLQNKGSKKWDDKALWALWNRAGENLKKLLGPYCNNGKEGKPPEPYLKHYWTGDK